MRLFVGACLAIALPNTVIAQDLGQWSGSYGFALRHHFDAAVRRVDQTLEFDATLEGSGQLSNTLFWDAELRAFASVNERDKSRLDVQNATLTWRAGDVSLFAGQATYSFGSALLATVADPINTKEFLAGPLQPLPLGQLVAGVRYASGQLEATALAHYGHRPAKVESTNGRFTLKFPVTQGQGSYTTNRGEDDFGYAVRVQHRGSAADLGFLYFLGASRDTFLIFDPLTSTLVASNPEIEIFGLDAQINVGRFLVAAEVVSEKVNGSTDTLFSLGAETEFALNRASLTTVAQISQDHGMLRTAGSGPQLLASASARLTLNDVNSSAFELAFGYNLDRDAVSYVSLAYEQNVGPSSQIKAEAVYFGEGALSAALQPFATLNDDSYLRLSFVRSF